jgi:hypothetical protein
VAASDLAGGSIHEVNQRLLLWARREGGGLARVEYSSEFARQRVEQQLQTALAEVGIAFTVVTLPTLGQSATEVVRSLLEQLGEPRGCVPPNPRAFGAVCSGAVSRGGGERFAHDLFASSAGEFGGGGGTKRIAGFDFAV